MILSGVLCLMLVGIVACLPTLERTYYSNHTAELSNLTVQEADTSSSWWYPNLDHSTGDVRDYVPYLDGNYDYPVYISIASGDADGFRNALYSDGKNNSYLSGLPRVVYLAPGTYVFDSTIYLDTDTVIIGDAINPPTIQAASGFSGNYLILGGQGDESSSGGEIHFSVLLKNIILDTTPNSGTSDFTALSWRVAQNSGLVNVQINMPQGAHTGIFVGQGSTISISDTKFYYGSLGLHWSGSQQATLQQLEFHECTTGISIDGGFTIVIHAPLFDTVGFSIVLNSGNPWVSVIDAVSQNSGTFFNSVNEYVNFMIENISKDTTDTDVVVVDGVTKVPGSSTSTGLYVYGNTYGANPTYQQNEGVRPVSRPSALAPSGTYPVLKAPQYTDVGVDGVINLKDPDQNNGCGLYGDGNTDETSCLQQNLNNAASQGKLAYLPYGIYRVTSTVTIPSGTRLIGNGWSTIQGYGSAFQDESNPNPIVQVGGSGSTGTAVIQDMRFSVGELLPGAIVLQVNMAGNNPGDVAIFNSLITIGGTSDASEINCSDESNCGSAYIGLHLSSTSSAYIDNLWAWVADHVADPNGTGNSYRTAAKGGILIEATKGTWLNGVGSEHWWLYNLNYHNAANVFSSLFQSETNYYQGSNAAVYPPSPFTASASDPSFSWCGGADDSCRMTIAQYFQGGSNIYQYGAGSWNFQSLDGVQQDSMNVMESAPGNFHLFGLCDHDATDIMRLSDGTEFGNANDGFSGSWETLVAEFSES